jgi:glycolate oxidase iron-sulfur subunit
VPGIHSVARRFALGSALRSPFLMRAATIKAAAAQRLGFIRRLPIVGAATDGLRDLPLPLPSARGGSWGCDGHERVVLFTGCIADTWFSDIHKATIEVLLAAGYRVDAPDTQTCCGALASHSGYGVQAEEMARANTDALDDAAHVIVNVAGCGAHLKEYGRYGEAGNALASKTLDVTQIVASAIDDGRLPTFPPNGQVVVVQDPCHLEHGQKVVDEPRTILRAAGYEVVDADPGGLCCGAAGVYQIDHPGTSGDLGRAKAEKVRSKGARLVASANAGCEMQLRRYLGPGYEILHPIEVYRRAMQ